MFSRALAEFEDFRTDMNDILGEGVLTDVKVKSEEVSGMKMFNSSSTRRVMIKWV